MKQIMRLKILDDCLKRKGFFNRKDWESQTGLSGRSTFVRDVAAFCDKRRACIEYDKKKRAYVLLSDDLASKPQELPGHWFLPNEVLSIFAAMRILEAVQFDIDGAIANVRKELLELFAHKNNTLEAFQARVKIARLGRDASAKSNLKLVLQALVSRRCLKINYHSRHTNEITERVVSPQRLTYYKDNWYLDSWCHAQNALRSFAVERIRHHSFTKDQCVDISKKEIEAALDAGYGIYAGRADKTAHLKFSPKMSQWVSEQFWHQEQKGWYEGDSYHLQVPYSDDRELVGEILRFGGEVEVMGPEGLKFKIKAEARRILKYG